MSEEFYRGRRHLRRPAPAPERGTAPPADPTLRAGWTTGKVLPFRRRAVKPQRRRRSPAARLLRPLALALLLVGLPLAAGLWLTTSPRFRVAAIDVEASDPEIARWVEERLAPVRGEGLLLLPLGRLSARLAGHEWVESLEISKQLPDRLRVVVEVRRPEALTEGEGGTLFWTDRGGRPIAALAAAAPEGVTRAALPVVAGPEVGAGGDAGDGGDAGAAGGGIAEGGVAEALALREELAAAHPVWGAGVSRVEALGGGDFRVETSELPFPLLLRSGEVAPKVHWLDDRLPELLARHGELAVADLRFDGRAILRPASIANPTTSKPGREVRR